MVVNRLISGLEWLEQPISSQSSHFIPNENIRKPFREYRTGPLARNGLSFQFSLYNVNITQMLFFRSVFPLLSHREVTSLCLKFEMN